MVLENLGTKKRGGKQSPRTPQELVNKMSKRLHEEQEKLKAVSAEIAKEKQSRSS